MRAAAVVAIFVAIAIFATVWVRFLASLGEPQSVWIMGLFQ